MCHRLCHRINLHFARLKHLCPHAYNNSQCRLSNVTIDNMPRRSRCHQHRRQLIANMFIVICIFIVIIVVVIVSLTITPPSLLSLLWCNIYMWSVLLPTPFGCHRWPSSPSCTADARHPPSPNYHHHHHHHHHCISPSYHPLSYILVPY